MTFRVATVLKEIGDERLKLFDGGGYWYFEFDDTEHGVFETHTVSVMRLNHLAFAVWVEEGKEFVAKMKDRISDQASAPAGPAGRYKGGDR